MSPATVTARSMPQPTSPSYPDLNGCGVLITGGAAGIGAALCQA